MNTKTPQGGSMVLCRLIRVGLPAWVWRRRCLWNRLVLQSCWMFRAITIKPISQGSPSVSFRIRWLWEVLYLSTVLCASVHDFLGGGDHFVFWIFPPQGEIDDVVGEYFYNARRYPWGLAFPRGFGHFFILIRGPHVYSCPFNLSSTAIFMTLCGLPPSPAFS